MFEPGQKVLCINDDERTAPKPPWPWFGYSRSGLDGLTAGEVYTVVDVYPHTWGFMCVEVAEIKRQTPLPSGDDRGFWAERFRPLRDPGLDVFRAMTREREDA